MHSVSYMIARALNIGDDATRIRAKEFKKGGSNVEKDHRACDRIF